MDVERRLLVLTLAGEDSAAGVQGKQVAGGDFAPVQSIAVQQEAFPVRKHDGEVIADPLVQIEPHGEPEGRREIDARRLLDDRRVPLHAAIIGRKKSAPQSPEKRLPTDYDLLVLLVVVRAGLVAGIAADGGTAERAERAAAGNSGADQTASRRAAGRADGLTAAHARATRQSNHTCNSAKRNERLHVHLLGKKLIDLAAQVQPRSRKTTNRTGIGTPRAHNRM